MGVFNNIQNALNTTLKNVPGIPQIYWSNVEKEPERNQNWVRPTLMPATSSLYTLVGPDRHMGMYQIDIFTKLKEGTAPVLLIADSIRSYFKSVGTIVSGGDNIHIQAISLGTPERQESWWVCYVQIDYLCFN